jgi:hypothetical protein
MAPSLLPLLFPKTAMALDCGPGAAAGSGFVPFITLNLSGGAALMMNYVPMDQGGNPLATYDNMGLGRTPTIEREFGNATFAGGGVSKILEGIRASASVTTIGKTAFVGVCGRSGDDSDNNQLDASGMVMKAGLLGKNLPNLGTESGQSTGIGQSAAILAPPAPLVVQRFDDIANSLGDGSNPKDPFARFSALQRRELFQAMADIIGMQVKGLSNTRPAEKALAQQSACAAQGNLALVTSDKGNTDPRKDTTVAGIWGLTPTSSASSQSTVFSSLVYNSLLGNAGAVGLEMGGFDYHGNSRASTDAKDRTAGVVIGQILETAAALGTKVFLYVTSDGSVRGAVSDAPGAQWTSDRGEAGGAYMISFDPAGRPATRSNQVNYFTSGQAAFDKGALKADPARTATAVFANYLSLQGKMGLFQTVAPNVFTTAELDQVLRFG